MISSCASLSGDDHLSPGRSSVVDLSETYLATIGEHLAYLRRSQLSTIRAAGELLATTWREAGCLFVARTQHTLHGELLNRASGPVAVAVLDDGPIGGGMTQMTSAHLTNMMDDRYFEVERLHGRQGARLAAESHTAAIERIAAIVEEERIDCQFERRPALTFTRDPEEVDLFDEEFEAARRAGLPVARVGESDLPFPIEAGIQLGAQASFHPLRYCLGLAAAVEGLGSRVYEGSRVVEVDDDQDPVLIRTHSGAVLEAPHVVLACGIPFLDRGGFFARLHPSRSYCVAMNGAVTLPDSMSINTGRPTISIRPITAPDGGRLLLVTGAGHKVGRAEDTERAYEILETFARRHFDAEELVARWSAQDYMSIDGLPLIGRMPASSNGMYVATGFGKWGLTMGTVAARIIWDQIRDHENPWFEPFDAKRSQIPEGLGEAIK
jgi:glycine/D-amino acid oxidase-like deaminating enzyme